MNNIHLTANYNSKFTWGNPTIDKKQKSIEVTHYHPHCEQFVGEFEDRIYKNESASVQLKLLKDDLKEIDICLAHLRFEEKQFSKNKDVHRQYKRMIEGDERIQRMLEQTIVQLSLKKAAKTAAKKSSKKVKNG